MILPKIVMILRIYIDLWYGMYGPQRELPDISSPPQPASWPPGERTLASVPTSMTDLLY